MQLETESLKTNMKQKKIIMEEAQRTIEYRKKEVVKGKIIIRSLQLRMVNEERSEQIHTERINRLCKSDQSETN